MTEPTRYILTLDVDVADGMAQMFLEFRTPDGTLIASFDEAWTTFCWTWKDVVEYLERRWAIHGGKATVLSRPSPYIDLT